MDKLTNKVALITGGGRGIGKEIAIKLAENGEKVCITARTKSQVDEVVHNLINHGYEAFGYTGDVKNPGDLSRIVNQITQNVGKIDVLVNNAGIANGGVPLWDDDPIRWWETLEVNLRGPMILSHLVLKDMISANSGTIINVSSFAGVRSTPLASAYGISKAAIARLSDNIAESVRKYNIGVFTISPGLVHTDMNKDVPFFKDLPPNAWSPIEKTSELVIKLITGKYNKLSGRFIHVGYDIDNMLENIDEIKEKGLYILRLPTLHGLEE